MNAHAPSVRLNASLSVNPCGDLHDLPKLPLGSVEYFWLSEGATVPDGWRLIGWSCLQIDDDFTEDYDENPYRPEIARMVMIEKFSHE